MEDRTFLTTIGTNPQQFFSETVTYCEALISSYTIKASSTTEKIENAHWQLDSLKAGVISNDRDDSICWELVTATLDQNETHVQTLENILDIAWRKKWEIVEVNPSGVHFIDKQMLEPYAVPHLLNELKEKQIQETRRQTEAALAEMFNLYEVYALEYIRKCGLYIEACALKPKDTTMVAQYQKVLARLLGGCKFQYLSAKKVFLFVSREELDKLEMLQDRLSSALMAKHGIRIKA